MYVRQYVRPAQEREPRILHIVEPQYEVARFRMLSSRMLSSLTLFTCLVSTSQSLYFSVYLSISHARPNTRTHTHR